MRLIDADALLARFGKQAHDARPVISLRDIDSAPTIDSPRDWTPCAEGLPKSEKQVLLTCVSENKRTYECKGYYLAKHSKEIGCADDLESDYDEETDRNYCPEGFYECIENWGDYSFVYIHDTVLAWQPLPNPYNPDHIVDANKKIEQDDVSRWPDWKKRAATCNYEIGKEDVE